jgi:hypothetical protein
VPDAILLKPGKLTDEEFAIMRTHTTIGQRILSQSAARVLQVAEQIALTHHERWDGTGYNGIAGTDIPLVGRIVCVVDVFDALTHERPYRFALAADDALRMMQEEGGAQFDPDVLDAFFALAHRVGTPFLTDDIGRPTRSADGAWPPDASDLSDALDAAAAAAAAAAARDSRDAADAPDPPAAGSTAVDRSAAARDTPVATDRGTTRRAGS